MPEELILNGRKRNNKIFLLLVALGPFFIFSIIGMITNLLNTSLFAELAKRPGLPFLAGLLLMLYSVISALYAIEKLKAEPKSIVKTIQYPAFWVSAFLVMSLVTNVVYFQISIMEGNSENSPQTMKKYVGGQFFLAFIIGFVSPFWGAMIFSRNELRQIFKTKYDSLYPEIKTKW